MSRSIISKYTLYTSVYAIVVVSLVFSLSFVLINQNFESSSDQQLRSIHKYFGQDIRASLIIGDHYGAYQKCNSFLTDPQVLYVNIQLEDLETICQAGSLHTEVKNLSGTIFFDEEDEPLATIDVGYRKPQTLITIVKGSLALISLAIVLIFGCSWFSIKYLGNRLFSGILLIADQLKSTDLAALEVLEEPKQSYPELNVLTSSVQAMAKEVRNSQNEMLRVEAFKAKVGVVRQVVHDIKSPLLALEFLVKRTHFKSEEVFELALAAAKRINDIVSDLSDLNRKVTQKFDVIASTKSIIDEKRMEISGKNVILNFNYYNIQSILAINFNESTWKRIISNLINNSIEAGGKSIEVVISSVNEEQCLIAVSDNGTGIPRDKVDTIFNEGVSEKTGNEGIGLFHAKKELEKMGANIYLDSTHREGCKFEILVPIDHNAHFPFTYNLCIDGYQKIVICDDNPDIHTYIKSMVSCEVDSYHRLDLALASIVYDPNSLYLFDYNFDSEDILGTKALEVLNPNSDNFYFVSNNFYEENLVNESQKHGVQIIPKNILEYIFV